MFFYGVSRPLWVHHLGKRPVLRKVTLTQMWCLLHAACADSPNMGLPWPLLWLLGPSLVPAAEPTSHSILYNQDFLYTACLPFCGGDCLCLMCLPWLKSPDHHIAQFMLYYYLWSAQSFSYVINYLILFSPYYLLSFPSPCRSLFYYASGHLYFNCVPAK